MQDTTLVSPREGVSPLSPELPSESGAEPGTTTGAELTTAPSNLPAAASSPRMTYGMHKGTPISEVPEDYLRWIAGSSKLPDFFKKQAKWELNRRDRARRAEADALRLGLKRLSAIMKDLDAGSHPPHSPVSYIAVPAGRQRHVLTWAVKGQPKDVALYALKETAVRDYDMFYEHMVPWMTGARFEADGMVTAYFRKNCYRGD